MGDNMEKRNFYRQLNKSLDALIGDERDMIANLANASALLFDQLRDINWAGFYLLKAGELVLGPFQGKPACIRIKIGSGVCGTAVEQKKTMLVPDVAKFPGHIVCDPASKSEIVVPVIVSNQVVGVLDIDSPKQNRFDLDDQNGLEEFVRVLVKKSGVGAATDDI